MKISFELKKIDVVLLVIFLGSLVFDIIFTFTFGEPELEMNKLISVFWLGGMYFELTLILLMFFFTSVFGAFYIFFIKDKVSFFIKDKVKSQIFVSFLYSILVLITILHILGGLSWVLPYPKFMQIFFKIFLKTP